MIDGTDEMPFHQYLEISAASIADVITDTSNADAAYMLFCAMLANRIAECRFAKANSLMPSLPPIERPDDDGKGAMVH